VGQEPDQYYAARFRDSVPVLNRMRKSVHLPVRQMMAAFYLRSRGGFTFAQLLTIPWPVRTFLTKGTESTSEAFTALL
jgi:hypothetical protein